MFNQVCMHGFGTVNRCKCDGYPFCSLHRKLNNKKCGYCKQTTPNVPKICLSNCAHLMCITCFVTYVYETQFFEGFTQNDSLFCPCCFQEISKQDWNIVIGILVRMKLIQPEIVFNNNNYNNVTYRVVYKRYTPPEHIDTSHRIALGNHNIYI
jgi:hypothetical protein